MPILKDGGFRVDDKPGKLGDLTSEERKEIIARYDNDDMIKPEEVK